MTNLPPYARFLGISTRRSDEDELQFVMPFGDVVLGRPGYVHGGALAGLLEFAAYGALHEALGAQEGVRIKPINVTVQYMRGARPARHDRDGHRHHGSASASPMSRRMPGSWIAPSRWRRRR